MEHSYKGASKMALVIKSTIHSDGGNRGICLAQRGTGFLNPVAIEILDWGEVKALLKIPLE